MLIHRCQYQQMKKRDRGRNWYYSTSSRRYTDFARATITRVIFIPGPTRPGLSQNTHNFAQRISLAEYWKLVAESSEFHLTLSRAHFFQLEISGTF